MTMDWTKLVADLERLLKLRTPPFGMKLFETAAGEALLANNGSAGMPNFRRPRFGLATRISTRPPDGTALYGVFANGVYIHAIPIRYDTSAWEKRFLEQWPAGTDAYQS